MSTVRVLSNFKFTPAGYILLMPVKVGIENQNNNHQDAKTQSRTLQYMIAYNYSYWLFIGHQ